MGQRLKDKGAVVTGGGRGIGREVALALAGEGARVVVVDPGVSRGGEGHDAGPADDVAVEIKGKGGTAIANHNSVTDFEAAREIIESCVKSFGRIDILVNCAGVVREKMVWNMTEEEWDLVIAVHLKGAFNCIRWAAGFMRQRRSGRIISMASAAWLGAVGQVNYAAAKGGIVSLTRSVARELGRYGVTCNCVTPRAATRMTMTDEVKAGWRKRFEAGLFTRQEYESRLAAGGPEYIAPFVVYLATEEAGNINGQVFHVEKGKVAMYSEPAQVRQISNEGAMFTLGQLSELVPKVLLPGYTNPAPPEPGKTAEK